MADRHHSRDARRWCSDRGPTLASVRRERAFRKVTAQAAPPPPDPNPEPRSPRGPARRPSPRLSNNTSPGNRLHRGGPPQCRRRIANCRTTPRRMPCASTACCTKRHRARPRTGRFGPAYECEPMRRDLAPASAASVPTSPSKLGHPPQAHQRTATRQGARPSRDHADARPFPASDASRLVRYPTRLPPQGQGIRQETTFRRQRQAIPQREFAGAVPLNARACLSVCIDSGEPLFKTHYRHQLSVGWSRGRRAGKNRPVRHRRGARFRYAG